MMVRSLPGIAEVVRLGEGRPRLLVEVPHGADRRSDYDALFARLEGPFPARLDHFFHVNTDVGAWAVGERVAQELAVPALLIRCLIPRTFIDCNRVPGEIGGDLSRGGATPGLQPYVENPGDVALLKSMHQEYLALCESAYAEVCGRGGWALIPHTYGPRSLKIARVDHGIVDALHAAHEPEHYAGCLVRKEIDLIFETPEGEDLAPTGVMSALAEAYAADGFDVGLNDTYALHPATMGALWAHRYPHQTVSLEIRRDLLVDKWRPFSEMLPVEPMIARASAPLVSVLQKFLPDCATLP